MQKDILQNQLRPGEKVLWSGRPQKIKLMEAPYNVMNIINWLIALAVFALVCWYCYDICTSSHIVDIPLSKVTVFLVVVGCVIVFAMASPWFAVRRMQNNYYYFITNYRAIAAYDSWSDVRVNYRDYQDISEVAVEKLSTGNSCIYIGNKTAGSNRKTRAIIFGSESAQDMRVNPLIFYSIENAEAALKAMPDNLNKKGGRAA